MGFAHMMDYPYLILEAQIKFKGEIGLASVNFKIQLSWNLRICGTWNRLLSGFHPGQLSFILRVSSETLPTAVNLCRWII